MTRCARLLPLLLIVSAACGAGNGGFDPIASGPMLQSATHVWAFSPTNVWVLDGSATVYRYDGRAWSTLATPSTGGLGCIYALSATQVWLCAGTQVLTYDGANFTASNVMPSPSGESLTSLWASSATDQWATGQNAFVYHFDGTRWTSTTAGGPNKTSVWGSAPNDVYALGTFDLYHYDGSTWSQINLSGAGGDGQVWGTSKTDVWVMPASSQISHYDGTTWKSIQLDIIGDLSAVWGPAPNDVWAAGTAGAIAHFDGSSWTQLAHQPIGAPYLSQLTGVHGSSAHDIWVVGHQLGAGGSTGLIYHRIQ